MAVKLGFSVKEGGKHILIYSGTTGVTTVPRGEIKRTVLKGIAKALGITIEEFQGMI